LAKFTTSPLIKTELDMLRITCLLFLGWIFSHDTNAQVRQLNLLGHWSDSTLVGSRAYNNTYNEIWGLAVNDREFAVIGSTAGTHIIDVTDPGNAVEVQFIAGAFQGTGVIHRDYHDFRGYLYAACDEGASTLQIIDITGLPDTVTVVYDSNEFFGRAHNIFIDTMHARLYTHIARGGSLPGTPMMLLDISTPDTRALRQLVQSLRAPRRQPGPRRLHRGPPRLPQLRPRGFRARRHDRPLRSGHPLDAHTYRLPLRRVQPLRLAQLRRELLLHGRRKPRLRHEGHQRT
jgi:hypothetical protein